MHLEKVHYEAFDVQSTGYVAYPEEGLKKHPAIILAHAWMGLDEFLGSAPGRRAVWFAKLQEA